jgi:hypothetical protein
VAHAPAGTRRAAGITTPLVVPIAPDVNQRTALDAAFKAFE